MNADQWRGVKEIFHEALERPANERPAFVSARAGGDKEIATEVERLLAAEAHSANFIEQPAAGATLTGKTIGRYKIGRLLGAGGMGEVYAARDVELGREVAIKFATADGADAQHRLRREAQHASHLNHPNICTIYEVGTLDGKPFIAMEHVAGERLADVIPEGGLPVDQLVRYGTQIADALAYAHRHGVIHRDLKTGNVGITPEGRAKVLDFGLARRLRPAELKEFSVSRESSSTATRLGGTLSCMAPETLRGEQDDERSDIWALGVMLYEMASGTRPFRGATPFQVSGAILHEPTAPLPAHVPPELKPIIARCLEKDPGKRYAQAADVRDALSKIASPAESPRASLTVSFGLSRSIYVLIAAVVLITVAGVLFQAYNAERTSVGQAATSHSAIAVMPFDASGIGNDDQLTWLSSGLPSMLTTGLVQTQGVDIVSARRLNDAVKQLSMSDLAKLDKSQSADVARRAGANAIVFGSIFRAGSEIRIDAQLEDLTTGKVLVARSVRGTDVFSLADQLTDQIRAAAGVKETADARGVADVSSRSLEAYRLYAEGTAALQNVRTAEARRLLQSAVQIDPEFAEAYLALAGVERLDARPADRTRYVTLAAQHADRLSERQKMLLAVELAHEEGDVKKAAAAIDALVTKFPTFEAVYSVALWAYTPIIGLIPDTKKSVSIQAIGAQAMPMASGVYVNYGYALLDDGQFSKAMEQYELAAKMTPREPNPYDSLAEGHLAAGLASKAVELYTRALTIDPTFPSNMGRSVALSILGRYDDALATPSGDPRTDAFLLSRVGRYRDAERLLAEARKSQATIDPIGLANIELMLSLFTLERGKYDSASERVQSAIAALDPLPPTRRRGYLMLTHTMGGIAAARAGRIQAAQGQLALFEQQAGGINGAIERLWRSALEGEIALAQKDWNRAQTVFSSSRNVRPWLALSFDNPWVFGPNLPSRDGLARTAMGRGDLAGAIEIYRRLAKDGGEEGSQSVLEPRHVLQLARLLDRSGDKAGARREYQRFLGFWKNADGDLPELAEAKRAMQN